MTESPVLRYIVRGALTPALIAAAALLMLCPGVADAQQFGKNKVQYRKFDWRYIQSDHFDIYFYDSAGAYLAQFTAGVAEDALEQIQSNWRYRITNRIPLVIYNSKNDFQQTNVVGMYMPEGVGGVTELFKNRIVVPFEGEWEKFRHVIHHELVHAALNDKFYGGTMQSLISNNVRVMLPGWMNEGLAEFEAYSGYNIETDMFIRDAVIGGYLPDLQDLGGYMSYRGGQTFYWYVEQNYGRQKVGELLNRIKSTGSLDAAFKGAFGKSLEEFSEQWLYDLKKIYWPDIADRKRAKDFSVPLTDHRREESFFNTSPAISPNGDKLAFISDRDGYRSVYVMNIESRETEKIAQGESDVDFEELHLITPALSWSPDGRRVAIAVKSRGRDAIYLIDAESGDRERVDLGTELNAIYSVDWSPDGTKLAFQGNRGEQSDIYVFDLGTRELTNITADIFSDVDPNWAADGRTIYFVSDRRESPIRTRTAQNFRVLDYDYDVRDIYSVNTQSLELRRITATEGFSEKSPIAGTDGRLLFISDLNGIDNIYVLDTPGAVPRPLTNSISGIDQLSITRDGSRMVFTTWNTSGYDIFQMRMPYENRVAGDSLTRTKFLERLVASGAMEPSVSESVPASEPSVRAATELGGYGNVRVDVSEAEVGAAHRDPVASVEFTELSPPSDSREASGDYAIKDYKIKFTPDLMMATGNYSSFYGVQGVAQMLFSDMLGDHQIYVATNLQLDLKNSDFVVSYSYLPEMIDYSLDLFQESQLVYIRDRRDIEHKARFRQYGLTGRAANPFSRFSRLEAGLTWLNVDREMIYYSSEVPTLSNQSKMMFVPTVSYIFDNSQMWAFGPISGSRYNFTATASPKLGDNGVGFYTLLGDARTYLSLGDEYTFAVRGAGGFSFGPDPQKFFIGGVENWLNYSYNPDSQLPLENAEDFTFLTPGFPMRGFDFNEQLGSKYFIGNAEFRFPLFRAIVSGPLPVLFQYVSGVLFADVGSAWNTNFNAFNEREDGSLVTDDLLIGTGIGARAYVFGMPVRFDVAWNYNLENWSRPHYYVSLGYDF
jgi:Tol biopolymer transport system component